MGYQVSTSRFERISLIPSYSEGRGAAAEVDLWLSGTTRLPVAGGIKNRVSSSFSLYCLGLTVKTLQVFTAPPSSLGAVKVSA